MSLIIGIQNLGLIFGIILVLFVLILVLRSGRGGYVIRSLIPAWRFFDIADSHRVFWVRPKGKSPPAEWIRVDPSHSVSPFDFWVNPSGLLVHSFQNLLSLFVGSGPDSELQGVMDQLAHQCGKLHFSEAEEFEFKITEEE